MQNQVYNSKLTIQHNDMSLKMIQAAHRMQHDFDVIINLSFDYFLLWATSLFTTPMHHLISMCSTTSYMDNITLQLINTHSKRVAFHTHAQAHTYTPRRVGLTLGRPLCARRGRGLSPVRGLLLDPTGHTRKAPADAKRARRKLASVRGARHARRWGSCRTTAPLLRCLLL